MSDDEFGNVETVEFGDEKTPSQVLYDALAKADEWQQIIVIGLDSDNDVCTGWSTGRYLNHIGMLTQATHMLCARMREGEDV